MLKTEIVQYLHTLVNAFVTWQRSSQSLSHSPTGWKQASCTAYPYIICKLGRKNLVFTNENYAKKRANSWKVKCRHFHFHYTSHFLHYTPTIPIFPYCRYLSILIACCSYCKYLIYFNIPLSFTGLMYDFVNALVIRKSQRWCTDLWQPYVTT